MALWHQRGRRHGGAKSQQQRLTDTNTKRSRRNAESLILFWHPSRVKLHHFSFYPKILNSVAFKHSASLWIGTPCFSAMLLPSPPCNISVSPRGSPRLIRFPPDVMCPRAGGRAGWLAGASHSPLRCVEASENQGGLEWMSQAPFPRAFIALSNTIYRALGSQYQVPRCVGFEKKCVK